MNETKLTRSTLTSSFPSNSDKSKREDSTKKEAPKVKSVVTSKAQKTKKTVGQKIKDAFIGDESKSVFDYIVYDVLIPASKSMLYDMLSGGLEMRLFGDRRRGSGSSSSVYRDRGRTFVSYDRQGDARNNRRDITNATRSMHDFDNIIFDTRADAESVLMHMADRAQEFGAVSVADFYEYSNIESQYTDRKYGWYSLRTAYTEKVRTGWIIHLPATQILD